MKKENSYFMIESAEKKQNSLAVLLATWTPLQEEFPEIEDLPADDVEI
jgi:hypothetical protein